MGHFVEKCYQLHGYPPGHPKVRTCSNFNCHKNTFVANQVSDGENKDDGKLVLARISEAQLQQLMSLLNDKYWGTSSQANAVVAKPGLFKIYSHRWIIDNGARNHISSSPKSFLRKDKNISLPLRMFFHLCWKSQCLILFPCLSRHSCQLHHLFLHHRSCFYLHLIPLIHPQFSLARHNQPQSRPFVAPATPIIHRQNYRIMYALTSCTFALTNLLPCFQIWLKVHVILYLIMFHIIATSLHITLLLPRSVKSHNPEIIAHIATSRRRREENLVCQLHKSLYGLKQASR